MVKSRRRNDEVRLRERVTHLATLFHQQSPLEHDVFRNWKHSLFKHRPHFVCQPPGELCALIGVRERLNTKADFCQGDRTDIEFLKRLCRNERYYLRLGPLAPK